MLGKFGAPCQDDAHKSRMQRRNTGGWCQRLELKTTSKLFWVEEGNACMNNLEEDFHEVKSKSTIRLVKKFEALDRSERSKGTKFIKEGSESG